MPYVVYSSSFINMHGISQLLQMNTPYFLSVWGFLGVGAMGTGIEPKVSWVLDRLSTKELQPQLCSLFILIQGLTKSSRLALNSFCWPGRPWTRNPPASGWWVARIIGLCCSTQRSRSRFKKDVLLLVLHFCICVWMWGICAWVPCPQRPELLDTLKLELQVAHNDHSYEPP